MARTFFTLEYQTVPGTAGTHKTFRDWGAVPGQGFVARTAEFKSQATSTITLALPMPDPSIAPVIPYYGWVVMRYGVTQAKDGTLSGGTIFFQGLREFCTVEFKGGTASQIYTFVSPWRELEQLCYQQARYSWIGQDPVTHVNSFATTYQSDLYLFQGPVDLAQPNVIFKWTTGQQIADVIYWAKQQGVQIDGGIQNFDGYLNPTTIELTVNVPIFVANDIMCSEAIQNSLKSSPDAVAYFDFSVQPPVLHVRKNVNLVAVTLPMGRNSVPNCMGGSIKSREDLSVPCVRLFYKFNNSENGQSVISYQDSPAADCLWPPTQPGGAATTGREIGALVQTIDMSGSQVTTFNATINTIGIGARVIGSGGAPLPPNVADQAARLAFWKLKQAQYRNANTSTVVNGHPYKAKYQNLVIGQAWIEDNDGTDITAQVLASFPNVLAVLQSGSLAPWMFVGNTPVTGQQVTIKAAVGFQEFDSKFQPDFTQELIQEVAGPNDNSIQTQRQGHEISCNVTLTNVNTGGNDQQFSTLATIVAAEQVPPGLAQSIYESLNTLQYDGSVSWKEQDCSFLINIGNVLNLSGGPAAFATARMLVQSVSFDFQMGTTMVTVGPAKHLGAHDLISIFLFNRFRFIYRAPLSRNTGQSGGGGSLSLNAEAAKENTVHDLKEHQKIQLLDKSVDQTWANPGINLIPHNIITAATELNVANPPVPAKMDCQKVQICDGSTGAVQALVILGTKPFAPTV